MLVIHVKYFDEAEQEGEQEDDLQLPILLPKYEQAVVDKVLSKSSEAAGSLVTRFASSAGGRSHKD